MGAGNFDGKVTALAKAQHLPPGTPAMAPGAADIVVGATVRKKFGNKYFEGEITELWAQKKGKEHVAHIVYEDGGACSTSRDDVGCWEFPIRSPLWPW